MKDNDLLDSGIGESMYNRYFGFRPLNEADNDEITEAVFDADEIFNKAHHLIFQKMTKIFGHTEDLPRDVDKARKMMEDMRDGATKEILEKIKTVCRTANSEQMGLSSKLSAFISKHPMRESYLTNLWKRHETDLNTRIERRIDAMSSLNGNGPLKMAKDFFTITIPKLVAMMVTYKCLIQLYLNKSCIDQTFLTKETAEEIQANSEKNINKFPQALAGVFAVRGSELNKDNEPVFDLSTNTFTGKSLDYLFPWVERILHTYIDQNNIDKVNEYVTNLNNYYTNGEVSKFFSGLVNIMIDKMKGVDMNNIASIFADTFDQIDQNIKNDIDTVVAYFSDLEHKSVFKSGGADLTVKEALAYVYASKGTVLLNFEKNKNSIDKLSAELRGTGMRDNTGLTDEQKEAVRRYLDNKVTDEQLETARKLANTSWQNKVFAVRQLSQQLIRAQDVIKFYYNFELRRCTELKDKSPYQVVKLFVDFISTRIIQNMFNQAGASSELGMIKTKYQQAVDVSSYYNDFLDVLGGRINQQYDKAEAQGPNTATADLSMTAIFGKAQVDDKTYSAFMDGCFVKLLSSDHFDTEVLNNREYNDTIKKNKSLLNVKSWNEVVKAIDPKTKAKSVNMFLNIDSAGNSVQPGKIRMLKDLLLYTLGCAKIMFNHSDTAEKNFEKDIWNMVITIGRKGNTTLAYPFHDVINNCISVYKKLQGNNEAANLYKEALQFVDKKLSDMFKSNNGYTLDSGLLETLCSSSNAFNKFEEMLDYIKNNIMLSGKKSSDQPGGLTDILKYIKQVFGEESGPSISALRTFLKLNYCSIDPSTGKININEIQ